MQFMGSIFKKTPRETRAETGWDEELLNILRCGWEIITLTAAPTRHFTKRACSTYAYIERQKRKNKRNISFISTQCRRQSFACMFIFFLCFFPPSGPTLFLVTFHAPPENEMKNIFGLLPPPPLLVPLEVCVWNYTHKKVAARPNKRFLPAHSTPARFSLART